MATPGATAQQQGAGDQQGTGQQQAQGYAQGRIQGRVDRAQAARANADQGQCRQPEQHDHQGRQACAPVALRASAQAAGVEITGQLHGLLLPCVGRYDRIAGAMFLNVSN